MNEQNTVVITSQNGKTCQLLPNEIDKYRLYYEFKFDVKYLFDIDNKIVVDLDAGKAGFQEGRRYQILSSDVHKTAQFEMMAEEKRTWLLANRSKIQNALVLSTSVYEQDPTGYLDTQKRNHTLESVTSNVKCDCPFAIAEDKVSKEIYLAFRGTADFDDLIADLEAFPSRAQRTPSVGTFHAGFLKRSESFPLQTFLESDWLRGKTLILCGHSLGGAVSSIVYLEILLKLERSGEKDQIGNVINITFGSPMFASDELRSYINNEQLIPEMYHFVASNDPVPRLVSLVLNGLLNLVSGSQNGLRIVDNLRAQLENHSTLINLALDTINFVSANTTPFGKVKELIKAFGHTREKLEQSLCPFGDFFFMKNNQINILNHQDKANIDRELRISFDQIDCTECFESHYLDNYKRLCEINKCYVEKLTETEFDRRMIQSIQELNPQIESTTIELNEQSQKLFVTTKGKRLASFQRCDFDSRKFLFSEDYCKVWHKSDAKVIVERGTLLISSPYFKDSGACGEIVIHTTFGSSNTAVNQIEVINVKTMSEQLEDITACQVLESAFNRFIDLKRVTDDPEKLSLSQGLEKLSKLLLKNSEHEKIENLLYKKIGSVKNPEEEEKDITQYKELMNHQLNSPLKLQKYRSNPERTALILGATGATAAVVGVAGGALAAGRIEKPTLS